MTAPERKVRGRPFQKGNPGRPRGSRNRTTEILEELGAERAEQLYHMVFEGAMAGNVRCQQLLLDRIWPPRKAQPINLTMPPINGPQDALAALAAICKAIGEGCLTPEEASACSSIVGRCIQVIELQDFERRIAALEEARDKQDEEKNCPTG